jgi:hypothetical protein
MRKFPHQRLKTAHRPDSATFIETLCAPAEAIPVVQIKKPTGKAEHANVATDKSERYKE